MDKTNIVGLYLLDFDLPHVEVTSPDGNPEELLQEVGLTETVLKIANEKCPKDDSEYFIHVLLIRETFETEPVFEIGIWLRKNCMAEIHPMQMKEIALHKIMYEYVEPDICKILHPTELSTNKVQELTDLFDAQHM